MKQNELCHGSRVLPCGIILLSYNALSCTGYTILYYTVINTKLFNTVMCCTVQSCAVWYCTILYSATGNNLSSVAWQNTTPNNEVTQLCTVPP